MYLLWGCCFGDEGSTILGYDYLELYGANAEAYTGRIVRSQSTLKDVIERYF